MHEQISLWECIYETKKINKPIRLIECFAGIGSQFKALKKVFGDKVESYKIVEWAYNSIIAYNNIHIKDYTDYAKDLTKIQLIEKVKGISINYNEPLSNEQLNNKPLSWLQKAYNNIKATHNLIDIMKVKGADLEIVDKDKYEYILSYSFPCQDLSSAGSHKGMELSQADGGTRSGAYAAGMILVKDDAKLNQNLRIRKLTPKETTRLMGFEDCDYDAMKQDLSDTAIYHCCGDSIVVNVLESIFKQMKG